MEGLKSRHLLWKQANGSRKRASLKVIVGPEPQLTFVQNRSQAISEFAGRVCLPLWTSAFSRRTYPVNLGKASKKSFGVSQSERASRVRSFHNDWVRPQSETQPTFATRFTGKISSP
jgi:hypothetical protein